MEDSNKSSVASTGEHSSCTSLSGPRERNLSTSRQRLAVLACLFLPSVLSRSHFRVTPKPFYRFSLVLSVCSLFSPLSFLCQVYALRSSSTNIGFNPDYYLKLKPAKPSTTTTTPPLPFIQHVPFSFDSECLRSHAELGREYITAVGCHIVITQPLPPGAAGPYTFGFFTLSPL